jgi:hypothetical protein
MKTYIKVSIGIILAVAAALLVRYSYLTVAEASDGTTPAFEDELLRTKNMFVEKSDAIQSLTAVLVDMPPASILRADDGTVRIVEGNNAAVFTLDDEAAQTALQKVFGAYESGGLVFNIEITDKAVLFFTYYNDGGCIGFLYEKDSGTTDYYEYFELVENWKLFFKHPDA